MSFFHVTEIIVNNQTKWVETVLRNQQEWIDYVFTKFKNVRCWNCSQELNSCPSCDWTCVPIQWLDSNLTKDATNHNLQLAGIRYRTFAFFSSCSMCA